MKKEEVCLRLIELYYTYITMFKNYGMSMASLVEKYNAMLKILNGDSND